MNSNRMLIFTIVTLIFPLSLKSFGLISSDTSFSNINIKSVGITRDDVRKLNGWPIERRWYSIAIKKLFDAGAGRIFIDISFRSADILHPESDELFYQQLSGNKNVFLLHNEKQGKDITILGDKLFNIKKVFYPFSDGIFMKDDHLIYSYGNNSLPDYFINNTFSGNQVLFIFPESPIQPDFKFSQILSEDINLNGEDVIIYLDYEGVSSYIVTPGGMIYSTSVLQIWSIKQLISGNYKFYWPSWLFLIFSAPVIICFILGVIYKKRINYFILGGLVLWSIFTIVFLVFKASIFIWWFLLMFSPVLLIIYSYFQRKKNKNIGMTNAIHPEANNIIQNENQVKELQYKLDYYEKLASQVPVNSLPKGFEASGIFCHKNSPLTEILRKAAQVAKNEIPVIIFGESGTGKEMLAQYIHQNSERNDKTFIAVNCGALNENLIESELFGYEKGSFTGAYQQKPGRFELANNGTLFLDEISETSLSFQVKLLRVLQEGVFERVGGTKTIKVSVRIIAATHQDLKENIKTGKFREDLYYRLSGYEFIIPPLRERIDDIEYLFKYFLYEMNPDIKYSEPLIEWLKEQTWPGNIRQLKSSIHRAVINARVYNRSFLITKDFNLDLNNKNDSSDAEALSERVLQTLRAHEFHHRSVSAAANDLMIHRSTVTEYLRGWIIRFLNFGNADLEYVITTIRGTAPVGDEQQYRNRIIEYVDYISTKINDGIKMNYSDLEIQSKSFKNLPGVFKEDLQQLIHKTRIRK